MRLATLLGAAALAIIPVSASADAGALHPPRPDGAREVMEEALVQFWTFFKTGDADRSGFIERDEFFAHPVYEGARWGEPQITFVLWMVDENKDGKVSLQEWFNNELGQFQMGDKNHDGIIDEAEYNALLGVQRSLFKALKFPQ